MPKKKRVYNKSTGRDYAKEYAKYQGTPEQRKRRSKRVLARRKMIKAGKAKKGDGKDVDHKNRNPMDDSMDNLRNIDPSKNRGYARGKGVSSTKEWLRRLRAR